MSIQAIGYVLAMDIRSSPQKLLLICIAGHVSNENGCAFPSQKKLGEEATMCKRQVSDHLGVLEEKGFIKRTMRHRPDGSRKSDLFELSGFLGWYEKTCEMVRNPTCGKPQVGPDDDSGKADPEGGQDGSQGAGLGQAKVRKSARHEPSIEPSVSKETGESPSASKIYWDGYLEFLSLNGGKDPNSYRSMVGRWAKRADQDFDRLMTVLEAAKKSGTRDPVPYLSAAIDREFPPAAPPPKPSEIGKDRWTAIVEVALERKRWNPDWGPPPGAKGCQVPDDLLTRQLLDQFQPETENQ